MRHLKEMGGDQAGAVECRFIRDYLWFEMTVGRS
jgi:hypothetical protein